MTELAATRKGSSRCTPRSRRNSMPSTLAHEQSIALMPLVSISSCGHATSATQAANHTTPHSKHSRPFAARHTCAGAHSPLLRRPALAAQPLPYLVLNGHTLVGRGRQHDALKAVSQRQRLQVPCRGTHTHRINYQNTALVHTAQGIGESRPRQPVVHNATMAVTITASHEPSRSSFRPVHRLESHCPKSHIRRRMGKSRRRCSASPTSSSACTTGACTNGPDGAAAPRGAAAAPNVGSCAAMNRSRRESP